MSVEGTQTALNRLMDWDEWHRQYDVVPSLQARLRIVQGQISAALDECRPGPIRVVSVCAGDGRDLIGALQNHPRCRDVSASLLDNHLESLNRGRMLASEAGLERQIRLIPADASLAASYDGLVPADLVILSGFLGHLAHHDVPRLIESLPMLCKTGGCAIWNRHLVIHDGSEQVPRIRELFRQAGFEEVQFATTSSDGFAAGRVRLIGETTPLEPTRALFEFAGLDRLARPGPCSGRREEAELRDLQPSPSRDPGAREGAEEPPSQKPQPPGSLFDPEQTISARFEQVVALHPSRKAIASGDWQPTYSELNVASNRLAQALLSAGTSPRDRVALLLRHDAPLIVAMLAVLKAGSTVVVLNPTEPPARLKQLLDDAQPLVIVTDSANHALAREVARPSVQILCFDKHLKGGEHNLETNQAPADMAFLVYTSGSTGRPKGVIQTHRNVLHNILRHTQGMELSAQDRIVLLGSPSGGQGMAMTWAALLNGAALCPFPAAELGVAGLSEWLLKHKITIFVASVSLLRSFLRTLDKGERFPSVRLVRFASEAASSDDLLSCRAHFSDACVALNTFSSSETGNITQYRLAPGEQAAPGRLSIGTPAPGIEIFLWDEDGREISNGDVGEIVVKSGFLSPGYWRDETLTAQRFSGGDDLRNARLFRTGDLARRTADGALLFMGRKDDRIKINGYRVELRAIEDALLKQPGVEDAVICAREAANGQPQLFAYVVSRSETKCTANALRQGLRALLPGYMVPARFIFLDEFPLTPTGKVDRQNLPIPDQKKPPITRGERPREIVEKSLTWIWQTVLGIAPIGRHDDFFDLGGTSLQSVEVLLHIEEKLGANLPPSTLAEYSTIAKLAPLLANHVVISSPGSLVVLRSAGSGRPLFLLHSGQGDVTTYGLLARRLPGRPIYGLQSVGLQGEGWPLASVPAMARRYLPEILAKDPTGPYMIAGTCMGGMIAFELAQLLLQQGRRVALLALFDVPHPRRGSLRRGWRKKLYDPPRENVRDAIRMLRWSIIRAAGFGRNARNLPAYRRFVSHMNGYANRHYQPRFYPSKATLFVTEQKRYAGEDLRLAMQPHIKEVSLIRLPGNRSGLFIRPTVDELARHLNACLERAEKKDPFRQPML